METTKNLTIDIHGRQINLPKVGDKVLRDGYSFTVNTVTPHNDICIVASILLRGESGVVEVGYYDYLKHKKNLVNVYGILMLGSEEQAFAKYRSNNSIAMNTKNADERLEITLNWLEKYLLEN